MDVLRLTVLLAAVLVLSACAIVFRPHRAVVTPAVSGTLEAAAPSGTPVKICRTWTDDCCTGGEAHAVTSSSGRFTIEPTTELRMLLVIMAHTEFRWCFAAQIDGTWRYAGPYRQYTLVDTGPAFPEQLECRYSDGELACHRLERHADPIEQEP